MAKIGWNSLHWFYRATWQPEVSLCLQLLCETNNIAFVSDTDATDLSLKLKFKVTYSETADTSEQQITIQTRLFLSGRQTDTFCSCFCSCDLDLYPMTSIYKLNLDIVTAHLRTKMKFLCQGFQKLRARTRGTDRHNHHRGATEHITTPHSLVAIIVNPYIMWGDVFLGNETD